MAPVAGLKESAALVTAELRKASAQLRIALNGGRPLTSSNPAQMAPIPGGTGDEPIGLRRVGMAAGALRAARAHAAGEPLPGQVARPIADAAPVVAAGPGVRAALREIAVTCDYYLNLGEAAATAKNGAHSAAVCAAGAQMGDEFALALETVVQSAGRTAEPPTLELT